MRNIEVIDNFFNNFDNIKDEFKKIPMYDCETYKKKQVNVSNDIEYLKDSFFPGLRSESFHIRNAFAFNLVMETIFNKLNSSYGNIFLDVSTHLRLAEDDAKDYVHTDPTISTMIVYLSETNMKSGTGFYKTREDTTPYMTVPAIQNTAVFFPGSIPHKSLLNYGTNIDDGRLTLNGFIYDLK